jgi:hypothetical protein
MPKCVDCNKSVSYGSNPGSKSKRCQSCFDKWAEKTGYYANTSQAKRIAENMRQSKGITPQALKPFVFKKGQKAHNYIGGICKVKECNKPFLAKGYCSRHYQHYSKEKKNE